MTGVGGYEKAPCTLHTPHPAPSTPYTLNPLHPTPSTRVWASPALGGTSLRASNTSPPRNRFTFLSVGITGVGGYEKAVNSMARISPAAIPEMRHARIAFSLAACLLGPVDPSFRALKFTVRRYKFNKDALSCVRGAGVSGCWV